MKFMNYDVCAGVGSDEDHYLLYPCSPFVPIFLGPTLAKLWPKYRSANMEVLTPITPYL